MMNVNLLDADQKTFFDNVIKDLPTDLVWNVQNPIEASYKANSVPRYRLCKDYGTLSTGSSEVTEKFGSSTSATSKVNHHMAVEGVPTIKIEVLEIQELRSLKSSLLVLKQGEVKLASAIALCKKQKAMLFALETTESAGGLCFCAVLGVGVGICTCRQKQGAGLAEAARQDGGVAGRCAQPHVEV
jgi:hypothetical protein